MGSNMAENHPVGFQWVAEAKKRGAKIIHVDPRFTRTSAFAHTFVPLRAGSDIAFLGGIVRHILEEDRAFKEYVVRYTNAATIISEDFRDTEDLDGLFSGWDPETRTYDPESWQYEDMQVAAASGQREQGAPTGQAAHGAHGGALEHGEPPHHDETLQHPRCVYQLLRKHFARYTPELVEETCGVSREQFLEVCEALCANSGRERTSALCYAVGWTQHTVGVQYIRTASIIQLLLGNIGRPGGGIMALRGHASIQGSTDIPTLYDILPGYLPMPAAEAHGSLHDYIEQSSPPTGYWANMGAYTVSLLKAWWGDAATAENDFCFDHLPRLTGDHSYYTSLAGMVDGTVKGLFVMGENPTVGAANGGYNRAALRELDWLVVRDLVEIETAAFWHDAPEIETGEVATADIATEVFFLPAATHVEKKGTFTNTQRLLQWREQAVEPRGDCRSELWFMYHLGCRVREKLAGSSAERDRAVLELTWDYPTEGAYDDPDAEAVLREIGGVDLTTGKEVPDYLPLKDDGSTACGCWIYAGCYAGGVNQVARRKPGSQQSPVAPEWGWAWPMNRRILYNRASADPDGKPWSERKRYLWWDADAGKWTGEDIPDFKADMAPDYRPPEGARGPDALAATSRSPCRPTARRGCTRRRARRRADAHALRAARVAVRQPALRDPAVQPRPPADPAPREPLQPHARGARRRGLPLRGHDLPADRAPHRGRDVALAALPGRAAARDVLRGLARAGARAQPRARRLDDGRDPARSHRGARDGHRAHDAADHRAAPAAPGRPALSLGLARAS